MAHKNAQGFTIYGRDKDENTIWVPFPKELLNSRGYFHQSWTKYDNGNVVVDITYYSESFEMPDYKHYMNQHVVTFTMGEKDVNILERIRELKSKLQTVMTEAREFVKGL